MTDQLDQAEAISSLMRDTALAAASAQAAALQTAVADDDCVACGDEIEAERRRAVPGARRCVTCQEALERHRREYRR